MYLVYPSYRIMPMFGLPWNRSYGLWLMQHIEKIGRTCYKSEDKITDESAGPFCEMLTKRGHTAMIEHATVSVRFIVTRGFTHELVRHRIASYAQESTRFCDYKDGHVMFIITPKVEERLKEFAYSRMAEGIWESLDTRGWPSDVRRWYDYRLDVEKQYKYLRSQGWKPEEARDELPIGLKTEIVITANLTEWLHIFSLRCSKAAHPQMRQLMPLVEKDFQEVLPEVFAG